MTFVNSVAPFVSGAKYYHSIVKDVEENTISGANNIIVGNSQNSDDRNHYVASWNGDDYKTSDSELIASLIQATPLHEDMNGIDDDILEEDIVGRERFLYEDDERWHRGIKVSYGPYEYQWFDE